MSFKQKWIKIITLCLIAATLTQCQKKETTMTHQLNINFQEGDLPSLHPHALMIYLRGLCIAKTLYEGLTRIDTTGKPILAGASAVEISPDGLQYTFSLRDNYWSNGVPVTAHHYEQAWKQALSPLSNCSRADLLYMIKNAHAAKKGEVSLDQLGVQAINDTTLLVTLEYPSPHFLELTAQPICAPLLTCDAKEPQNFNGPFFVEEWKKGDYIRLKANPLFWNKQHVYLQQIEAFFVQESSTSLGLYEQGKIDWIGVPFSPLSTEQIVALQQQGLLRSASIDRAFWVFLNTQNPILSSPQIRSALSLAIDRQAITDHIFLGGSPLDKALPLALLPIATTSPISMDLEKARGLFTQGLHALHLTKESLPPLKISYSQQSNRKQLAEYLQQAWSQAFEIDVQLIPQEWNVLRTDLEKGEYEISGCFEAAFYRDPIEIFEKFTTCSVNNFSKWVNPEFTEKVLNAKVENDLVRRGQLLAEAEALLVKDMPFIPISSDVFLFSHLPKLTGYVFDCIGAVDFSYASLTP